MTTKLTLTLDKTVIDQAKHYAKINQTSLSELVSNYFKFLNAETSDSEDNLSPKTKRLKGVLSAPDSFDYKVELLEEKLKKHG